jgi:predicted PurR-regulated permease PerM
VAAISSGKTKHMAFLNRNNIIIGLGLALLALFTWHFSDIVTYVLIAWVLSVVIRPVYIFFRKHLQVGKYHAPKTLSVLFAFTVVFGLFALIGYLFVPVILEQAGQLSKVDFNSLATKLETPMVELDRRSHEWGFLKPDQQLSQVLTDQLRSWFKPTMIAEWLQSIVGAAGNLVVGFTSVFFILFYFLSDSRMFTQWMMALVPKGHEGHAKHVVRDSGKALKSYFRGVLMQMLFVTIFLWIGLAIAGIRNALLIAFFGAIMNVIPYVGPIIGAIFGVLLTVSSHLDADFYPTLVFLVGKVVLVFSLMQLTDNFFVSPYIFSRSVEAHPLEIFFVVMISAKLGGVFGMLIAIPCYTILRILARAFLGEYKFVQVMTQGLSK